jgi:hypothetical protein
MHIPMYMHTYCAAGKLLGPPPGSVVGLYQGDESPPPLPRCVVVVRWIENREHNFIRLSICSHLLPSHPLFGITPSSPHLDLSLLLQSLRIREGLRRPFHRSSIVLVDRPGNQATARTSSLVPHPSSLAQSTINLQYGR